MFCNHCGAQVHDQAVSCPQCGVQLPPRASAAAPSGSPPGMMFCRTCGSQIAVTAAVCVHCGAPVPQVSGAGAAALQNAIAPPDGSKSWVVAVLLCFFVGWLGVHRFYLGHTLIGVLQLVTLGGFGIWALIDLILILFGAVKDKKGRPLVK